MAHLTAATPRRHMTLPFLRVQQLMDEMARSPAKLLRSVLLRLTPVHHRVKLATTPNGGLAAIEAVEVDGFEGGAAGKPADAHNSDGQDQLQQHLHRVVLVLVPAPSNVG